MQKTNKMEIDYLKKILFKWLLGRENEREREQLNDWVLESKANEALLERLEAKNFLQQAIGEHNKELRQQEWNKLKFLTIERNKRTVGRYWVLKVAAAVLLPLIGGVALWFVHGRFDYANDDVVVAGQIRVGSSKAIVELANGEQIFLTRDTTVNIKEQGIELVNQEDTLKLLSKCSKSSEQFHVIRIPRGGEYIACLEDGSVIHLNSDSELKVPVDFGKNSRQVWLKGEGYFNVAKDKKRVFVVHTAKADVSVLGTEFDVRAYGEENDVVATLVNGSVAINSGDKSNRLLPGEQAQIVKSGEIKVEKVDVYPYTAWIKGRMVFVNERLEKIMTDLQRWYDFDVFYANPSVQDMRFTIDILKYDDISKVLNLIEKMEKVSFNRQNRTVVVNMK